MEEWEREELVNGIAHRCGAWAMVVQENRRLAYRVYQCGICGFRWAREIENEEEDIA